MSQRTEKTKAQLAARYERLEKSRSGGWGVAVTKRYFEIDGLSQAGLLAIELFTVVIPLIILSAGYRSGFAANASVGNLFAHELGLKAAAADQFRSAFGTASGLESSWTFIGVAGFLLWGIPMSITVAAMFGKAWRREEFPMGARLWRGAVWFLLYLAATVARSRIVNAGDLHGGTRLLLFAVGLIPLWIFWSVSPIILVRDGSRDLRSLVEAGLAGVVIDGIILYVAARIVIPLLLSGWTGFGPIGVAMTLMTWCGVIGSGWVATAAAGAVTWERSASIQTVLDTEFVDPDLPEADAAAPTDADR